MKVEISMTTAQFALAALYHLKYHDRFSGVLAVAAQIDLEKALKAVSGAKPDQNP